MKRKVKKILIIVFILLIILLTIGFSYYYFIKKDNKASDSHDDIEEKINYNDYFYDIIKTLSEKKLYVVENDEIKEIGSVNQDVILKLEKDDNLDNGYFKIKDSDYYIDYKDIEASDEEVVDLSWKNYIPFNESIRTTDTTNLYLDSNLFYSFNTGMELPIVIKEDEY